MLKIGREMTRNYCTYNYLFAPRPAWDTVGHFSNSRKAVVSGSHRL